MIIGIDVPLLYETRTDKICNYIFLADVSKEVQKNRVLKRKNMNIEKFNKINNNQLSNTEKKKKKPIIIPTGYGKIITFVTVILNLSWIIIKTKSIKI
jgi:dephospho-CoA kinase